MMLYMTPTETRYEQIHAVFYSFQPMSSHLHRVADTISWVISPVVVAPAAYAAIVMLGFGDDLNSISFLMVLFFASTIAPVLLITGLKKTGKISDYNITFREQRFLPLLALVGVNALGYEFMQQLDAPRLLTGILLFNAVNMVVILLITLQWKISIHLFTLASSVALLFVQFGATAFWLLPLVPLLMWSRILLKAHNFMQTLVGGVVGFIITFAELTWWTGL
jgi:membrane-associated phospholipid phosphatase